MFSRDCPNNRGHVDCLLNPGWTGLMLELTAPETFDAQSLTTSTPCYKARVVHLITSETLYVSAKPWFLERRNRGSPFGWTTTTSADNVFVFRKTNGKRDRQIDQCTYWRPLLTGRLFASPPFAADASTVPCPPGGGASAIAVGPTPALPDDAADSSASDAMLPTFFT